MTIKLVVIAGTNSHQMASAAIVHFDNHNCLWPEISGIRIPLSQREQYDFGRLLAKRVGSKDIIKAIVTHSDHIFNGIRIAIKRKFIRHDEVEFRFYRPDLDVITFQCDADARFNNPPVGFFDQLEISLAELL